MALGFNVSVRNARLSAISAAADAGTGAATITVHSGTKPAVGGTATTTLVTLNMSDPAFNAPSGGTMSARAISSAVIAASGTATWFRIKDSSGTFVCDGTVGTASADMIVPTVTFTAGVTFNVSSLVITDGN